MLATRAATDGPDGATASEGSSQSTSGGNPHPVNAHANTQAITPLIAAIVTPPRNHFTFQAHSPCAPAPFDRTHPKRAMVKISPYSRKSLLLYFGNFQLGEALPWEFGRLGRVS
jgi:hypothetical protein